MAAKWELSAWPGLAFHAFLSHCEEDRDSLVVPVKALLEDQRIMPWIDRDEYPLAQDPSRALRDQLVLCCHVVYFITPALLKQGRGWCAVERAYSELLPRHFEYPTGTLWSFELPLIFLPRADKSLKTTARSAWAPLLARATWFDDRLDKRLTREQWAVQQIPKLILQQNREIRRLSERLLQDFSPVDQFSPTPGLIDRVTSLLPRTRLAYGPVDGLKLGGFMQTKKPQTTLSSNSKPQTVIEVSPFTRKEPPSWHFGWTN